MAEEEWSKWKGRKRKDGKKEEGGTNDSDKIALHRTGEKMHHFKYMREFHTILCPALQNGVCALDDTTCFQAHDRKNTRRHAITEDGQLLYEANKCENYDAKCPQGSSCRKYHSQLEIKFHPLVYKVTRCKYSTNAAGHCEVNGPHCSFAHSDSDLRHPGIGGRPYENLFVAGVPVSAAATAGRGHVPPSMAAVGPPSSLSSGIRPSGPALSSSAPAALTSGGHSAVDAQGFFEQNLYKTIHCARRPCTCDGWHHERERRRTPVSHTYSTYPCPYVYEAAARSMPTDGSAPALRKGFWGDPTECPDGDECQFSHTAEEQMYHPDKYKTALCARFSGGHCSWGVRCSYAHGDHERRLPASRQAAQAHLKQVQEQNHYPPSAAPPNSTRPTTNNPATPTIPQTTTTVATTTTSSNSSTISPAISFAAAVAPSRSTGPPPGLNGVGVSSNSNAAARALGLSSSLYAEDRLFEDDGTGPLPTAVVNALRIADDSDTSNDLLQTSWSTIVAPLTSLTQQGGPGPIGTGRGRGVPVATVAARGMNGLAGLRSLSPHNAIGDSGDELGRLRRKVETLQTQLARVTEQNQNLEQFSQCPVCLDNERGCAFYPCGHIVCIECATNIVRNSLSGCLCPQCRTEFTGLLRVYF